MKSLTFFAFVAIVAVIYVSLSNLLAPEALVVSVRRGNAVQAVTGTITVEPEIDTQILSSGVGFMIKSDLKEGISVSEGQIVAQIDPDNLPFEIRGIQLQLNSAKKLLTEGSPKRYTAEELRSTLTQNKELVDLGHYPKTDYANDQKRLKLVESQIRTEMESTKSKMNVLENKLRQYEDQLDRLNIRAPFDGTITTLFSHKGDLMSIGKPIAKIISNKKRIHAEVSQNDIATIRTGNSAQIRLFAYPNKLYQAEVRKVIPDTDPATLRFIVYLEILDPPKDLLPGIKGEVSFYTGEKTNTLIIPRQALLGNNNVLVAKDGEINIRKVKTGFVSYSEAEILEGVEENELVVIRDLDLFRKGDSVKIKIIESH